MWWELSQILVLSGVCEMQKALLSKRCQLVELIKEAETTPEQREHYKFKGYGRIMAKGTELEWFQWHIERLNLLRVVQLEKLYEELIA